MKILFTDLFLNKFPLHTIGLGVLREVTVVGPTEETDDILKKVYPKVRQAFKGIDLPDLEESKAYINVTNQLEGKRFGYPYQQIERVLMGKQIMNINNIVNQYMAYELLSNLSFSAYDLDKIAGGITVDLAGEGEKITRIGGEVKKVPQGDIVFRDNESIIYSYSVGYADKTKVLNQTRNVLFVIDAPSGIEVHEVEKNMQSLCAKFESEEFYIIHGTEEITF